MAKKAPKRFTLRAYRVGFGDCFLLTFHYDAEDRHVLIDFGSMALPKGVKSGYMTRVAEQIKKDCDGKLTVLAASHRHWDHIAGFSPDDDGKGPGDVIRLQESALRQEGYAFLRGGDVAGALMHSIERMMAGAITDTFYLEPDSPAIGRTLAQLDLRGRTRALVIAVVRDGKHHLGPEADFEFRAGDILVLVGDHAALEAAYALLSPGPTSPE